MNSHLNAIILSITITMFIGIIFISINSENKVVSYSENSKKDVMFETKYHKNYEELKASENTVVIYPIFTQSAYEWGGIHDFYQNRCAECTSTEIQPFFEKRYASSGTAFSVLEFLGYNIINDIDLDKNPDILSQFEKVILLHNEYVTENEFNAITTHPNVIYLYPNSLSSRISVDYESNVMTLQQGPGFPDSNIKNGFDWEFDNSQFMSDWDCNGYEFYKIDNGYMLNCYPEKILQNNGIEILKRIKEL
ncbi:hypothetical protein C6988_05290 [Nitrosopumilus sp. b1]|uniref:hypothetical protein n=1 Tax=Nitrosopumilus sp. b1 TaxID=2109907 RepID=UPI0015F38985|nr:hypothetical protein [Nitrosopumilus sp. b1]KAF6243103.1 hypothetical protein C6988_05290 [Nitrosopumilus sp. b1]